MDAIESKSDEPLTGARRAWVLLLVQGLPLLGFLGGMALLIHEGISRLDLGLFLGMYLVTMVGIEIGYHRLLAHRSFEVVRPLRALFLIAGSMAGQGSALLWSAVHRVHHATTDTPEDPHSPVIARPGIRPGLHAFLWAQFLWFLDYPVTVRFGRFLERHRHQVDALLASRAQDVEHRLARTMPDLLRDEPLLRLNQRYNTWLLVGFALPAVVGGLVTGSWAGALRGLVWGGFVRYYVVQQVTFAINSLGHIVGTRPLESRDYSRNNLLMVVLTVGSGWHNHHHTFPGAARLDFKWWQVDPGGLLIRLLERLGLAWDVRMPTAEAIARAERRPAVQVSPDSP